MQAQRKLYKSHPNAELIFNEDPYVTTDKFCIYTVKEYEPNHSRHNKQRILQLQTAYSKQNNPVSLPPLVDVGPQMVVAQAPTAKPIAAEVPQNTIQEPTDIPKQIVRKQHQSAPNLMAQTVRNYPVAHSFAKLKVRQSQGYRSFLSPKSHHTNLLGQLVQDVDVLQRNKELFESVLKLKSMNLLKPLQSSIKRYPGVGCITYVSNDNHSKSTNNGYSRNFGGVFYTR